MIDKVKELKRVYLDKKYKNEEEFREICDVYDFETHLIKNYGSKEVARNTDSFRSYCKEKNITDLDILDLLEYHEKRVISKFLKEVRE